eukprot:3938355-Pleurochrysis_carterae.AAC.1
MEYLTPQQMLEARRKSTLLVVMPAALSFQQPKHTGDGYPCQAQVFRQYQPSIAPTCPAFVQNRSPSPYHLRRHSSHGKGSAWPDEARRRNTVVHVPRFPLRVVEPRSPRVPVEPRSP